MGKYCNYKKKIAFLVLGLGIGMLSIFSEKINAETIVYPGFGVSLGAPAGGPANSLFSSTSLFGNQITVNSGGLAIGGNVYGGVQYVGTDRIYQNSVTINGGTMKLVYGGFSQQGVVDHNTVTINGGATGSIFGGYSRDALVSDNTVLVNGATVSQVYGGASVNGNIDNNHVVVNNATTTGRIAGGYSDSASSLLVSNNSVTLSGSSLIKGNVMGGFNSAGDANYNTLTINPGVIIEYSNPTTKQPNVIAGGYSNATPAHGNAEYNRVIINGGTLYSKIYGGFAWGSVSDALGNEVILKGGDFYGDIEAGFTESGKSNGNVLSLSGALTFAPTVNLFGGKTYGSGDVYSGNTLIVNNPIASPVKSIQNFENYQFVIPARFSNGDVMLRATGLTKLGTGANVSMSLLGGTSSLAPGDKIILIGDAGTVSGTIATPTISASQGISLTYDLDILIDPANAGDLVAKVTGIKVNPSAKVPVEGIIGSLGMLLSGNNHLIYGGIPEAKALKGNHVFATVSTNHLRLNSGSHVKVEGTNLIVGAAFNKEKPSGTLLVAPFAEAGWGNYDTYNRLASYTVKGDGDTNYYGGGMFARYDITKGKSKGLYTELSLHAGKMRNKFYSHDLISQVGEPAKYDLNTPYYSAHTGIGYQWKADKNIELDISGRYLWTRQDGNSAVIQGDRFKFDALQSHRTQIGGKVLFTKNERMTPYIGLTYEHEFGGTAKAKVHGRQIESPSLKGDTGIGELGIMIKPKQQEGRLSLDIKLLGNFGKKEGVGASLYVDYKF